MFNISHHMAVKEDLQAHYLDALETAIRDHRVTGHKPMDTADIYRAIGTLEVIVQTCPT